MLIKIVLFLKSNGIIFFAFPPWRMPFGGHQQIVENKFLSNLPFYHILPKSIYKAMLKMGNTDEEQIECLLEIKETGISISRFTKIIKNNHYKILAKTDWFINPTYKIKFNLTPRKLFFFNKIPFIRDFFTTCYYCIIQNDCN